MMEAMLRYPPYQRVLQEEQYIQLIKESQLIDDFDIQYRVRTTLLMTSVDSPSLPVAVNGVLDEAQRDRVDAEQAD